MTLSELVTITRRALRDTVGVDADKYWPDMDLEEYLNEAQEELAKRTLCLIESLDATICTITLLANVHSYPLSSSILQIDEVRPSWRTSPLDDGKSFRFFSTGWAALKGLPSKYCSDYSSGFLTLDNNPAAVTGETLALTVRRLPKLMTVSQYAEIPPAYQRSLRYFACHRALDVKDVEVGDSSNADKMLQKWEKAIGEIKTQEAQRQPRVYVSKRSEW
jgi:hypothetical protein